MEFMACVGSSVVSLSHSNMNPSCFVSLCENGFLDIMDTRCHQMCLQRFNEQGEKRSTVKTAYYNEVLFADDQYSILSSAEDGLIELYDTRKASSCTAITRRERRQDSVVCAYHHKNGVAQFLAGPHPKGESTTLFIDDNGAIIPICISTLTPTTNLPAAVFEDGPQRLHDTQKDENTTAPPSFGELSNICCGLSKCLCPNILPDTSKDSIATPLLIALGMDGFGALHSSPFDFIPFQISFGFENGGRFITNPPLPTCMAVVRNRIAIGRQDGTFTIADIPGKAEVVEALTAPGHPTSGLCAVEWLGWHNLSHESCSLKTPSETYEPLLTVSFTGDLTVWKVQEFLLTDPDESGADDDTDGFPGICSAYSIRDSIGSSSITNCMTSIGENEVVFGDTLGNILLCNIEILST